MTKSPADGLLRLCGTDSQVHEETHRRLADAPVVSALAPAQSFLSPVQVNELATLAVLITRTAADATRHLIEVGRLLGQAYHVAEVAIEEGHASDDRWWWIWVRNTLHLDRVQTKHLMRVGRTFGDADVPHAALVNLRRPALYALASDDMSDSVRAEAIRLAESGRVVRQADIRDLVEREQPDGSIGPPQEIKPVQEPKGYVRLVRAWERASRADQLRFWTELQAAEAASREAD